MRIALISLLTVLMIGCTATAQRSFTSTPLTITGDSLPQIRHITDMKITGDTLWFVYETEDGFGQRFLRKAVIDKEDNILDMGPVFGKKPDGYFMAYMPYPVCAADGSMAVVNQEDGEIFNCDNDSTLIRINKYILSGNSTLPFPISQYVQDISSVSPDNYVFIGREPNGGEQYAMKANIATAEIDTIRKIQLTPELTTWLPNAGELAYSQKHDRLAFAYRLHPVIEIFGMDGKLMKQVRLGEDTFNPATLAEADFEEHNPLHFVDIVATPENIIALHWNCKYSEVDTTAPTIYIIDWNGNIRDRIFNMPMPLYKIAVDRNNNIIGWNGKNFFLIN